MPVAILRVIYRGVPAHYRIFVHVGHRDGHRGSVAEADRVGGRNGDGVAALRLVVDGVLRPDLARSSRRW